MTLDNTHKLLTSQASPTRFMPSLDGGLVEAGFPPAFLRHSQASLHWSGRHLLIASPWGHGHEALDGHNSLGLACLASSAEHKNRLPFLPSGAHGVLAKESMVGGQLVSHRCENVMLVPYQSSIRILSSAVPHVMKAESCPVFIPFINKAQQEAYPSLICLVYWQLL